MSQILTPDMVEALGKPFPARQIGWKIQTNPKTSEKNAQGKEVSRALVVCYIDVRDVYERLNQVVPGNYSYTYQAPVVQLPGAPSIECYLTVCGQTAVGVGTIKAKQEYDEKDIKGLYSDGLKRAGVSFGIGKYLYDFPNVKADAEKYGSSWYLTRDAQRDLIVLTHAVSTGQKDLPKFTALSVSGYIPLATPAVVTAKVA